MRQLSSVCAIVLEKINPCNVTTEKTAFCPFANEKPVIELRKIRKEKTEDYQQIREILVAAFETPAEADLVETLRDSGCPYLSWVCEENGGLIGHILFTPVQLQGEASGLRLMGLAPLAVLPSAQNSGVGSLLIKAGIQACRSEGDDAIVVLGHPAYYPRFGFVPAVKHNIKSVYDVPDDVFMILALKPDALKGKQGIVRFHAAFSVFE